MNNNKAYLFIEHPVQSETRGLLENGWRVTCSYLDGTHCDIDVLDDEGNVTDLISETLIEDENCTYDYIYSHYRPHVQIAEET